MKLIKVFAVGAVLVAGTAYAQERTDPSAIARGEVMGMLAKNITVLGEMAEGKVPYDAAAAEAAKAGMIEAVGKAGEAFKEPGGEDPVSRAKPEIWTNWDDFLVKATALNDAVNGLDVASAETIGAGMAALGGACSDCHKSYQLPKK